MGRARRRRDLAAHAGRGRRCRASDRSTHRRNRHDQSTRDGRRLGSAHVTTAAPCHRVAGPAHRGALCRARAPPAGDPRAHRARARSVLLRDEDRVVVTTRCVRRACRRRVRHDRRVVDVAAHRWNHLRHRSLQRVADHVVGHPGPTLVRHAHRPLRRRATIAPRGRPVDCGVRRDGRPRRRARGHPHRGAAGRSAGGVVRAGVLRARHGQEHLRHRIVRVDERRPRLPRPGRRSVDDHRLAAGRRVDHLRARRCHLRDRCRDSMAARRPRHHRRGERDRPARRVGTRQRRGLLRACAHRARQSVVGCARTRHHRRAHARHGSRRARARHHRRDGIPDARRRRRDGVGQRPAPHGIARRRRRVGRRPAVAVAGRSAGRVGGAQRIRRDDCIGRGIRRRHRPRTVDGRRRRRRWRAGGRFEPIADRASGDGAHAQWRRAVERSRAWTDDD